MQEPSPSSRYESAAALRAATERHVVKSMGDEPIPVVEAKGVHVKALDGREYLDAISGEWVLNLGYGHPAIRRAVDEQLDRVEYVTPVFDSEPRTRLAEKLAEITPGRLEKTLYALSGGGAVEGAMRLAMRGTSGSDFVCFDGGFHGRTFATTALSYVYPAMLEGSNRGTDRYLTRQIRLPAFNCYRCPLRLARESCGLACADLVDHALERAHTHGPAGVVVEPVQANGGIVPAPDGFLPRLQEICRARQVPLIADEVQSAFCRCGPMFASQHYRIEPDLIVLGKSIGGGFPLAATVATPEYSTLAPWEYGFTQMGHPISCTASLAMIRVMEEERLDENATRVGTLMTARLCELQERSRLIGDVRGPGLMIGVELVRDRETKEPANEEAVAVMEAALERGLMLGRSGPVFGAHGNVIKLKPAVNVTEAEAEAIAERFAAALEDVERALR